MSRNGPLLLVERRTTYPCAVSPAERTQCKNTCETPGVATNPDDLLATLAEVGFAKSRGDARRLVEQGGIRINGGKAAESAALKDGDVLQAGKRNFVRIRLK